MAVDLARAKLCFEIVLLKIADSPFSCPICLGFLGMTKCTVKWGKCFTDKHMRESAALFRLGGQAASAPRLSIYSKKMSELLLYCKREHFI